MSGQRLLCLHSCCPNDAQNGGEQCHECAKAVIPCGPLCGLQCRICTVQAAVMRAEYGKLLNSFSITRFVICLSAGTTVNKQNAPPAMDFLRSMLVLQHAGVLLCRFADFDVTYKTLVDIDEEHVGEVAENDRTSRLDSLHVIEKFVEPNDLQQIQSCIRSAHVTFSGQVASYQGTGQKTRMYRQAIKGALKKLCSLYPATSGWKYRGRTFARHTLFFSGRNMLLFGL